MRGADLTEAELEELVPLLGAAAQPVHMPVGEGEGIGGGDVDCVVLDLDRTWPLRAPGAWRLMQVFRYDVAAWYWVLEREGRVIAIDTLNDEHGIGQYAWPISERTFPVGPGTRAAYLTAKRIRKGIRTEPEWARIRQLAGQEPAIFVTALKAPFGRRADSLAAEVLRSGVPERSWDAARRSQRLRRVGSPSRALLLTAGQSARILGRIFRPTGLSVLLVGPDGTGKSTLSIALRESCAPLFRHTAAMHWRPGVLPRSGASTGAEARDVSRPHDVEARGHAMSLAAASYHWLDFFIGEWTKVKARLARSTLIVSERGWHDLAVDPLRYRISISPALVRFAGRALPKPDLVAILATSPTIAAQRKSELSEEEIARQSAIWASAPPPGKAVVRLDADRSPEEVADELRARVMELLNERALRRIGGGWAGLPRRSHPRWWIPRRPTAAAASGLSVYQPVTAKGLAGWSMARAMARVGAMRALRRGPGIPEAVRAAVALYLERGGAISLLRANHPHRYVALLMDSNGRPATIVKLAFDERGAEALALETSALASLARSLPEPLTAPEVLGSGPGSLAMRAVAHKPRRNPRRLDPEVARALGRWFGEGATDGRGPQHGDFAPWNLLRTASGWTLVDWERADAEGEPFADVFHYFVQSHALLGNPGRAEVMAGLQGGGEVGRSLWAYAEGGSIGTNDLHERFANYLRTSSALLPEDTPDGARGREARAALLSELGS